MFYFYRYDGIYKVVKYYPEKGISGFTVWRFVLRRDDPTPAPWTTKGKQRISQLGLEIIVSLRYLFLLYLLHDPSTGQKMFLFFIIPNVILMKMLKL